MSKHVSTEDIKESLKTELDKSRPGNLKPSGKEKIDIADGKDKTEPEKQKPSDCISLVELCHKFIESRLDRNFSEKTLNDYQDSNNLLY